MRPIHFVVVFFLAGCGFWETERAVQLRFGGVNPAWVSFPPSGILRVGSEGGTFARGLSYGSSAEISVSGASSGWAVWRASAGEPLGAVWTSVPDNAVLDARGGWLAEVVRCLSERGVPVENWDLAAIDAAFRRTSSSRPAVFWDHRLLASDLIAGREGPGLFRLLKRRELEILLPQGTWYPEWEGLPSGVGEWPVGLWSLAGDAGRVWVQIGPTGPALLRHEP